MSWWRIFLWLLGAYALLLIERGVVAHLPWPLNEFSFVLLILIIAFLWQLSPRWYVLVLLVALGTDSFTSAVPGSTTLTVALILLVGWALTTNWFTHRTLSGSLLIGYSVTWLWVLGRYFFSALWWWFLGAEWVLTINRLLGALFFQMVVVTIVVVVLHQAVGRWLQGLSPQRLNARLYG